MLGVEVEEEAVDVEGVGVEEAMVVMVDMETTKVGTIRVAVIMIIKVGMAAMIIKVGMEAMIIKVGMVVDMATTKADMETTKVRNPVLIQLYCWSCLKSWMYNIS